MHQLLRQMVVERAARQGGQVSVSGVLAEMVLERRLMISAALSSALAKSPR